MSLLEIHIIRSIISVVNFIIACIAVSRGVALVGAYRWGPWTVAAYAYGICFALSASWNRTFTSGIWFIIAATVFGVAYVGTVLWAWQHPSQDTGVQRRDLE